MWFLMHPVVHNLLLLRVLYLCPNVTRYRRWAEFQSYMRVETEAEGDSLLLVDRDGIVIPHSAQGTHAMAEVRAHM